LGRNAIVAAAEMATQLHGLTGRWPGMTLNIARIDGGGPSNIVPDRAVLRFNIRYADPQHAAEIRQAVQQTLDAVAARFEVSAWLQGEFSSPPKLLDAPTQALLAQFQDCGEALGLKIEWGYSGGASDGNRLAAAGVPNLDTLGPRGGAIHSHDEFVLLDSLPERARLTALFLMRLADGTLPPLSHSAAPT
jgi:glutamate carboxypeptidase